MAGLRQPRVAGAPVSWGVFELTTDDPHLPGPELLLDQVQAAGYAGTELGPPGFLGDGPTMASRLRERGLSLVGAFLPQRFSRPECLTEDRAWMTGVLDLLARSLPDPIRPKAVLSDTSIEPDRMRWAGRIAEHPELRLPPPRFQTLMDNLHRAAELALERGFEPVFHSHAGSYIETDDEIRRVAEALDPSLCGLCLDTGHARFGGADPVSLLRDYRSLVRHVHVKDCDLAVLDQIRDEGSGMMEAWRRGIFCELGTGSADIAGFLAALRELAYEGWVVVEQDRFLTDADTPAAMLALQTRNREYLRAHGF